jgi:glycosyltransferase involved in cell wall biosynthesis
LVSCSDVEGMPNVVLEAMSSGLPVAATRVGGVSEVVQHGVNGFVHCPEHEAGLLQSLQSLVEDRDLRLRLGKSARAYVEHNHSLDSLSGVLQTLYQRTLA